MRLLQKIRVLIAFLLILCLLGSVGCNHNPDEIQTESTTATELSEPSGETTGTGTSAVSETEPSDTEPSETSADETKPSETTEAVTEKPDTEPKETQKTGEKQTEKTNPPSTDKVPTETTKPETKKTEETKPAEPEPPKQINAKTISVAYAGYQTSNEPKPYVKGTPIYGILYSGARAQVGDKISFSLSVSPSNHTDNIVIEASKGLSYTLSGSKLTVSVDSDANYGAGNFTVYAIDGDGRISASAQFNFAVDKSGNPFTDLSSVLSAYITAKKMNYTSFSAGYTTENPSLSITGYAGAPAWDDIISLSETNHIERCLWLIDQYKSKGFTKVNFIITETSIGFCAAR